MIVDKNEAIQLIFLKWVFIYKYDADGFLIKHKARLVVRGDMQKMDNQDVYAATLAFKVFRTLVVLMTAFSLETRQLDAINAFLNAHNDEAVYCYMPDGYRQPKKVLKVLKVLYEQRKFSLLWLRILCIKCMELGLYQISGKSCFFINQNGIFLFFYVDDIVFAYKGDRMQLVENYVSRFKRMFEIKNMGILIYFLGVRMIRDVNAKIINLVQDVYIDKLIKEYQILFDSKASTPIPYEEEMRPYENEIDAKLMDLYKKKVGSICYSTIIIRPDIAKAAFKLVEHLKNPGPVHMEAADQCLRYLYSTKFFGIEYSAHGRSSLMVQSDGDKKQQDIVMEATADVSFVNEKDRRSGEKYTFKFFENLIDWAARKQLTVITSTIEAEFLSMLHAGKEII